jgi:hypothetical protein
MIELTVMSPAPANDTQTFESDDNVCWANGTQVSGEVTVMMDSTSDGDPICFNSNSQMNRVRFTKHLRNQ